MCTAVAFIAKRPHYLRTVISGGGKTRTPACFRASEGRAFLRPPYPNTATTSLSSHYPKQPLIRRGPLPWRRLQPATASPSCCYQPHIASHCRSVSLPCESPVLRATLPALRSTLYSPLSPLPWRRLQPATASPSCCYQPPHSPVLSGGMREARQNVIPSDSQPVGASYARPALSAVEGDQDLRSRPEGGETDTASRSAACFPHCRSVSLPCESPVLRATLLAPRSSLHALLSRGAVGAHCVRPAVWLRPVLCAVAVPPHLPAPLSTLHPPSR